MVNQLRLGKQTIDSSYHCFCKPLALAESSSLKFQNCRRVAHQQSASLSCDTGQTYDPSSRLAVHKLLSIGPLLQELIRGFEVCRDGPFAKPQGRVPESGSMFNPVKI